VQSRNAVILRTVIGILAVLFLLYAGASAQEATHSEISVQGTGIFTKDVNGQGISQHATDTGGVLGGYRYRINNWVSAEAVYGWNRNSQVFTTTAGLARVRSDMHQATAGLVVNLPVISRFKSVSPYLLAEGGALVFHPRIDGGFLPGVRSQVVGVFAYGGGADFPIPSIKHVALRLEYRGLVYNAPNFGLRTLDTGTLTHTAEPSAGLVFRF
jgi:Outer membrane protein beta-barrel domain